MEYANFPSIPDLDQITIIDREKRLFHIVEYLEITTVYPLLLFIYQRTHPGPDRDDSLALLETFLVRRTICKLSNKNYNRLFISWIVELRQSPTFTYRHFADLPAGADKETDRIPSNTEVFQGFHETFLYNPSAREILYFIALAQLQHTDYQDTRRSLLPVTTYSVEHILPKKWPEHWNRPKLNEEQKEQRNWQLKRMGNLTLITGKMNSKLRNGSWKKKRAALAQNADLPMTKNYLDLEYWDEEAMRKRADDLGKTAVKLWPLQRNEGLRE